MCPDQDVLSAYLDGELPDRWRTTVDHHVQGCAACAARLAGLRTLSGLLAADDVPGLDPAMSRVRAVLGAVPRPFRAGRWRLITVPMPLAVAAAALVMILGGALVFSLARPPWTQFSASRVMEPDQDGIAKLLEHLNADAGERTVVFEIPADYHFATFGEPELQPAPQRAAE